MAQGTGQTIMVTGYAKAPQGTSMYEQFRHAGVVLEIDPATETIVDAEFTFVTQLAQRFCRGMVIGYRLGKGLEPLVADFRTRYAAPSQQAVIMALRVAVQRYHEHRSGATKVSELDGHRYRTKATV